MKTTAACHGCRDDFYNSKNDLGVERCWSADTAEIVPRYAIHYMTRPSEPGAFERVSVPNCYRQSNGLVFYEKLPDFVDVKNVRGRRKGHAR